MMTRPAKPVSNFLSSLLTSPWLRPFNDLDALEGLAGCFDETWSLTRIKARVIAVVRETADVSTLVLRPNRLWPGHVAGQHLLVEVEIDGRRVRRTFTIASPPRRDGTLAITVKRHSGGKLSVWWNERAAVGAVLGLGLPTGDFVVPAGRHERIAMLSAGSGITPVMALARSLREHAPETRVLFVHSARSREDVIFRDELEEMAGRWHGFDLRLHLTGFAGRLDEVALSGLARTVGGDLTYACGPSGFLDATSRAWREAGNEARLRTERFGLRSSITADYGVAPQHVRAERAGVSFVAAGGRSLLVEAEAAGLRPASGCRMGICQTCKCRKLSGVVEDLRDGRVSREPNEMIQLCVSAARSAVTLEL
jgi:ferredoxin-NADP reductase